MTTASEACAAAPTRGLIPFFVLVFVLSAPLWIVAHITGGFILPALPISALMAFCPAAAAAIVIWWFEGRAGVIALLKRAGDWHRLGLDIWLVLIVLLMPGLLAVAYVLMRLSGVGMPAPEIDPYTLTALFIMFFAAAMGEELGWSGFAIDRMQARWGAASAALLLGVILALWHLVPYSQTGRAADWIAWHCIVTVAARVLRVWLYNNSGRSVFGMALAHAMANVAYFSFPVGGSHYDAAWFAPVIVAAAIVVVLVWGPLTLTGRRSR